MFEGADAIAIKIYEQGRDACRLIGERFSPGTTSRKGVQDMSDTPDRSRAASVL